jgi:hypothetical protein
MKQFLVRLFLELLLMAASIDSPVDAAFFVTIVHIQAMEYVNG